MSYEKTTWETGDIITAEKMNNIENGIVSAENKLVKVNTNVSGNNVTLNKTWQEIFNLISAGALVYIIVTADDVANSQIASYVLIHEGVYIVKDSANRQYKCATSDGYPVFTPSGGN